MCTALGQRPWAGLGSVNSEHPWLPHGPDSEGLLVGTTSQAAGTLLQGVWGTNTGEPSQVAESPLGQRRPEGL